MKITGLSLGYGERLIVDSVDLEIRQGSLTVIVGPNGSGKSTLLRGMSRLLRPRAGTVHLDGVDIADVSSTDLARRLALLPQAPVTPQGLTVGDLVARGRFPHRAWYQRWSDADDDAVRRALTRVDLLDRSADQVSELSGGQRQRAWLAMVLAQDTDHLLLDEPTTYLDLAHAVEVMSLARDIAHESSRTVVGVLHDLTLAARFADHMVVLSAGQIVATGSPDEVVTSALLAEVFGLRAEVITVDGAPAVVPTRHR
ncbi:MULTISPECIES: ABC transporter ATP-binding protein [Nocardioides]|uniref:ABC transporter ATP-binding protein n=1 Tax=Nocardioides TaxID=1839 RepID=UPI000330D3E7|nr:MULTISPECIES: ABC transporter ATP-binding protein [Nocardioides]EON24558.1 ABC transporter-like protein [Nocardioides sp. CF8]